tara:strand:- start:333 stop:569 length:237 start_codon:yes stop_codon:yes gene_type:complete
MIFNKRFKNMIVRDIVLALTSIILAGVCFFIAKYIFQEIYYTIIGALFMAYAGVIFGIYIMWILMLPEVQKIILKEKS